MRYLVVSDIHSNFPALQRVIADAQPFDGILCLGDIVGYGPNPNECVERLSDFDLVCIPGNHDWGVIGKVNPSVFNRDARHALSWTRSVLTEYNLEFIASLPVTVEVENFLLAHGSPRDPIWEYTVDLRLVAENFLNVDFEIALVGHTHIPVTFEWLENEGGKQVVKIFLPDWEAPVNLGDRRLIINPGSVGQPRDGDPRASYAILDTVAGTWEARRVEYAVEITQERMRAQGLPQRLIDRLEIGR